MERVIWNTTCVEILAAVDNITLVSTPRRTPTSMSNELCFEKDS